MARLGSVLIPVLLVFAAAIVHAQIERIRNDKVLVLEGVLAPGEQWAAAGGNPRTLVYLDDGVIHAAGTKLPVFVKRGQADFLPAHVGAVRNAGAAPLRVVSVEFLSAGGAQVWGSAGLAPGYKVLFENQYGRIYDIRIAAGKSEPQHSHHDRVVISLSGAELEHLLPDGRKEASTLKTGEIAWRRGGTHVGHNLGNTGLWVIAVEPK